jgi:hypothetical protein
MLSLSYGLSGATPLRSQKFDLQLWQMWVPVTPRELWTIGTHIVINSGMEERDYAFDPRKNTSLTRERGISFEQVIALIESSKLIQCWSTQTRKGTRTSFSSS